MGLVATVKSIATTGNTTTATIAISGTPTAVSSVAMGVTIPSTALSGGTAITATENTNAKWDMVKPIITVQPISDKGVTAGSITGNLTVSATASNDKTPSYQWYSCNAEKANEALISGATSASFTIPTTLTVGTYYYFCRLSETYADSVDTNVVTVVVTAEFVAPSITTEILSNGTVGTAYSEMLAATGNTPITWSLKTGSVLPEGLSLNILTGVISGNPTTAGTTTFTVIATNGENSNDEKQLSITIEAKLVAPTITTEILSSGTVGTAYSQTLQATGDTPITWSLKTGSVLPEGLSLNILTGVIGGNPTTAGTTTFTVVATNGVNPNAEMELSITINAAPVTPPAGGGSTGGYSTTKTYHYIKGANSEWESNSGIGLEFTVDGEFSNFSNVQIDGKTVDSSNYTAKSGSIIITLKPEYLATLSIGTHKLTVVYTDGSVTTSFTINAAESADVSGEDDDVSDDDISDDDVTDDDVSGDDDTAEVADDSNPLTGVLLGGLGVMIVSGAMVVISRKKRK